MKALVAAVVFTLGWQSPLYEALKDAERKRTEYLDGAVRATLPIAVVFKPGRPQLAWVSVYEREAEAPPCLKGSEFVVLSMEDSMLYQCQRGARVEMQPPYTVVLSMGTTTVLDRAAGGQWEAHRLR